MTQQTYLEILFADLGMSRAQRNAWLSHQLNRSINYLDSLTVAEASFAIDRLRQIKAGRDPQLTCQDEDE